MKLFAKTFALASLSACALASSTIASAQVQGNIGTVNAARALLQTSALQNAYNSIGTTYAAQIASLRTQSEQRQTLLKSFDTNGDNEVDDAEMAAKQGSTEFSQLETLQRNMKAQSDQIDFGKVYAIQEIYKQYPAALQEVITSNQVQIVVAPDALLYAPNEADLTPKVTASLNTKVSAVGVVPPAGWQPTRASLQLFQEIEQTLALAQAIQARQQQAAQQTPQVPAVAPAVPAAPVGR
ncbi:MAG: OmpH family outer membrane protein [Erythrobacter sp.]|uniref:OmpH family outer membrane protein n=1 Tax=Parasphingorhabdus sp. TaxID=2709688 RepID=UPI00326A2763